MVIVSADLSAAVVVGNVSVIVANFNAIEDFMN